MGLVIYNLLLPIAFLFFLPELILKYRNRGGWKNTYAERFGRFSADRQRELSAYQGAIWIHAVSVGETVVALGMIRRYLELYPDRNFVISTTTTTGQELARSKCPERTTVIFCPIDFPWMVRRVFKLLRPSLLVIFETELWPNLLDQAKRFGVPAVLVNGRMSDHSAKGYRRLSWFFRGLLKKFRLLAVQTPADAERFRSIAPQAPVEVFGNLKFDQAVPEGIADPGLAAYFGSGNFVVLLAASTHPGEEELITRQFIDLSGEFPDLRLVIVPRHAERGEDISAMLTRYQVKFCRRSQAAAAAEPVKVLLADTTGEMFKFIKAADIVIMGKSLAGHDEGHNLIEPALLDKPIVTGAVLRNFRFILQVLHDADAVVTVSEDAALAAALRRLVSDPQLRQELGQRAGNAIRQHRGATDRTIKALESIGTTRR